VTDWNSNAIAYAYDDAGRMTTKTLPSGTGIVSAYTYDDADRLTGISHVKGGTTTIASVSYTLDDVGNRTQRVDQQGTHTYAYDDLYRLTSVTYPGPSTTTYAFDAFGNRLTMTVGTDETTYTYDDADKLLTAGGQSMTYDDNGNLLTDGAGTYTWDYASRMTGATVGSTTATYAYDGEDVRIGKTVASTPTAYLWDRECGGAGCTGCEGGRCGGSCGAGASSNSGVPLVVDDGSQAYLHADGLVAEIASSTRLDHLTDGLGSSRALTNATSGVVGSSDYDVFGAQRTSAGTASVFRFTGEQQDAETGWTYLRARYFDPVAGRFPSADTVRPNAPGTQGYNLYAYVANNPTTWVDPTGHFTGSAPAATIPRPSPYGTTENMAPLIVAGLAAGGLAILGPKLAGVFEYIALMLNEYTRTLVRLIEDAVDERVKGCEELLKSRYNTCERIRESMNADHDGTPEGIRRAKRRATIAWQLCRANAWKDYVACLAGIWPPLP
jgi:RHS repeat-associated protein